LERLDELLVLDKALAITRHRFEQQVKLIDSCDEEVKAREERGESQGSTWATVMGESSKVFIADRPSRNSFSSTTLVFSGSIERHMARSCTRARRIVSKIFCIIACRRNLAATKHDPLLRGDAYSLEGIVLGFFALVKSLLKLAIGDAAAVIVVDVVEHGVALLARPFISENYTAIITNKLPAEGSHDMAYAS